jgi:hypothetical protein
MFLLFFLFVFVMLMSVILIVFWIISKQRIYGEIFCGLWLITILFTVLFSIVLWHGSGKIVEKEDYYGTYIIKRNLYPGKEANWQYNTFRFEIKKNDSIYFYVTDQDQILETHFGYISTRETPSADRLVITMNKPVHHILQDNPTLYRNRRRFYLVFQSAKFKNVFFQQGKWKKLVN